jgi:hypothetical protein
MKGFPHHERSRSHLSAPELTPLQFLLEHQDEYRKHWRLCIQKMGTLRQRLRNPRLDLYRRMEAASAMLELERHLEVLGELTGPPSLPQGPPAIIYRFPDVPINPTEKAYYQVTRYMELKPPLEPIADWAKYLADTHPVYIAAGLPTPKVTGETRYYE